MKIEPKIPSCPREMLVRRARKRRRDHGYRIRSRVKTIGVGAVGVIDQAKVDRGSFSSRIRSSTRNQSTLGFAKCPRSSVRATSSTKAERTTARFARLGDQRWRWILYVSIKRRRWSIDPASFSTKPRTVQDIHASRDESRGSARARDVPASTPPNATERDSFRSISHARAIFPSRSSRFPRVPVHVATRSIRRENDGR